MFWHFVFQSLIKIFEMILFDQSGVCVCVYISMYETNLFGQDISWLKIFENVL